MNTMASNWYNIVSLVVCAYYLNIYFRTISKRVGQNQCPLQPEGLLKLKKQNCGQQLQASINAIIPI